MRRAVSAAVVGAVVLLGGALGAGTGLAAEPAAQGANPDALVRLAHLSPDTPAVDIYLDGPDGAAPTVVRDASYGAVTDYLPLTPGTWDVEMLPAGAPTSATPLLNASATVAAGDAYSVFVTGTDGDLSPQVMADDLSPVPDGGARARVVQASPAADMATLQAVGGPLLAQDVPYGSATDYSVVPAGRWSVAVATPGATEQDVRTLDLKAGTVNSVVVVSNQTGGFDLLPVVDGAGVPQAETPVGAVPAGFGGGALGLDSAASRLAAGGLLVLVAGSVLLVRKQAVARS